MDFTEETSTRLHELCEDRRRLDTEIKARQNMRDVVNQQIVEIAGAQREGSQSMYNGFFRIVTTGKVNRKLCADELAEIIDHIPEALSPFEFKPTLNLKKLRALEMGNPELYKYCCRAIEETNAKPSVKVEGEDER